MPDKSYEELEPHLLEILSRTVLSGVSSHALIVDLDKHLKRRTSCSRKVFVKSVGTQLT